MKGARALEVAVVRADLACGRPAKRQGDTTGLSDRCLRLWALSHKLAGKANRLRMDSQSSMTYNWKLPPSVGLDNSHDHEIHLFCS